MIKIPGLHAYTLLALQGAVWGSSFQAIKYALMKGDRLSLSASVWMSFLLIGFFNCALPFFLIPWGEQTLDSGRAAILNSGLAKSIQGYELTSPTWMKCYRTQHTVTQ
jgi:hypothetical protein